MLDAEPGIGPRQFPLYLLINSEDGIDRQITIGVGCQLKPAAWALREVS